MPCDSSELLAIDLPGCPSVVGVGNPGASLGLPWALAWHRSSTGTSVPLARTSVTALGGLQVGYQ